jgi:hypothetical protein
MSHDGKRRGERKGKWGDEGYRGIHRRTYMTCFDRQRRKANPVRYAPLFDDIDDGAGWTGHPVGQNIDVYETTSTRRLGLGLLIVLVSQLVGIRWRSRKCRGGRGRCCSRA